jgi:hypothetical protein
MTETISDLGTAALPAAILAAIDRCAEACRATLTQLEHEREDLRARLERRIRVAPEGPARTLCAVDGSQATVQAAGATFLAIAAVAVEQTELTDQDVLVQVLPPIEDLEAIVGGLRTIMELRLLARRLKATSAGLFILDGSFSAVLMEVNRLLIRYSQDQRATQTPGWWEHFRPQLAAFFDDEDWRLILESRRVVAHPKQTAASEAVALLAPQLSGTISDRTLWSTVLAAGEYALPTPLIRQDRPHLLTGTRSRLSADFGEKRQAIERAYGQLYTLYYRPFEHGPAYRIELPGGLIAREPLGAVFATFRAALQVNSVQEPLPQFLADAICRQIGRALDATAEGARTALQQEFALNLVQRYLGPYRTR